MCAESRLLGRSVGTDSTLVGLFSCVHSDVVPEIVPPIKDATTYYITCVAGGSGAGF